MRRNKKATIILLLKLKSNTNYAQQQQKSHWQVSGSAFLDGVDLFKIFCQSQRDDQCDISHLSA